MNEKNIKINEELWLVLSELKLKYKLKRIADVIAIAVNTYICQIEENEN